MLADLHTHTTASDGLLSPHELVSRAKEAGVEMLAITDHDTVSGVTAVAEAIPEGLQLIPGVELSANWRNLCIHVVGLNIDLQNQTLLNGLQKQQAVRQERAVKIAERMERAGFKGVLDGARKLARNEYIGRPHFARYLVSSGQIKDEKTAFKKYLGQGKPGDVRHGWPAVEEAIAWVIAAGGSAVIAHPSKYKLTNLRLEELCREFREFGGAGVEVVSGFQEPTLTRKLARMAERHGLLVSTGSDFHRPGLGWADLGRASPLPASCSPVWERW
jgi:hypothetical protein